jgi:hypothetical protein
VVREHGRDPAREAALIEMTGSRRQEARETVTVGTTTRIAVLGDVNPGLLFDAAREAAGNRSPWLVHPSGEIVHIRTDGSTAPGVSVVAPVPPHMLLPVEEPGIQLPGRRAEAWFTTSGYPSDEWVRDLHAGATAALGGWLTGQRLRWQWSTDQSPWWKPGNERRQLGDWVARELRDLEGLRRRLPS